MQALKCGCAEPLLVDDRFAGKRIQCPACQVELVVPERNGEQPGASTGIKTRQPIVVTEQPPPEQLSRWGEDAVKPLSPRPRWKVPPGDVMVLWMLLVPFALGLGWLIAAYCSGAHTLSQIDAAKAQMKVIETAVDEYRLSHGGPPPSLTVLLQPDPARNGMPYFEDIKDITDPWGRVYGYTLNGFGAVISCTTPSGVVIGSRW
jgi:hypothetical protein